MGPSGAASDSQQVLQIENLHKTFHIGFFRKRVDAVRGIDLQVLGIGGDGHIAFNEPGSSLGSRTRLKTLTQRLLGDAAVTVIAPG